MRCFLVFVVLLCFGMVCGSSRAAPFDDVDPTFFEDFIQEKQEKEDTPEASPAARDGATPMDAASAKGLSSSAKALRAYRLGDVDACLSHLRDAVAKKPTLPPPDLILAGFHLNAGRHRLAREQLERFAAEGPKHPQMFMAFSKLALAEGRLTDAWAHLEIAANLGPPLNWNETEKQWFQTTLVRRKTAIAEQRGNWTEAVQLLERLMQIDSKATQLRTRYATALFAAGQRGKALEQFDIAHRSNPRLNPPEVAMAVLSFRQGDVHAADRWYERAIEVHPDSPAAHLEWAIALLHQDRAEEAALHAQQAEKLGLQTAPLLVNRGMIDRQLGKATSAIALFQRALKAEPGHTEATRQLTLALAGQSDGETRAKAVELAASIAREEGASARDVATLAWVQFRAGQQEQAKESLERALASGPSHPESLYLLGRILVQTGDQRGPALVRRLRERIGQPGLFVMRPAAMRWLDDLNEPPFEAGRR